MNRPRVRSGHATSWPQASARCASPTDRPLDPTHARRPADRATGGSARRPGPVRRGVGVHRRRHRPLHLDPDPCRRATTPDRCRAAGWPGARPRRGGPTPGRSRRRRHHLGCRSERDGAKPGHRSPTRAAGHRTRRGGQDHRPQRAGPYLDRRGRPRPRPDPSAAAAAQLTQATGIQTDTLARLTWAIRAGRYGRVCLVGDDRQLGAVGAGGILKDLEAAHGAVRLTRLHCFTDPDEAAATLKIRHGDPAAIDFYVDGTGSRSRTRLVSPTACSPRGATTSTRASTR